MTKATTLTKLMLANMSEMTLAFSLNCVKHNKLESIITKTFAYNTYLIVWMERAKH